MSNKHLGRARSATAMTASRYKQEYPPSDECIATFLASPTSLRRASSEGKLAVLHHQGAARKLEPSGEKELEAYRALEIGSQVWEAGATDHNATTAGTSTATPSEKYYLNMEFEACIEEHPHTQVLPKLMHYLNLCYKYTKLVVYCICLILVGVPMTFVWGCVNGAAVFCCVWLWGPTLKLIKLSVHSCAPACVLPVQVICTPIVDVFARILRQVRMQAIVLGRPSLEKFASRIEKA